LDIRHEYADPTVSPFVRWGPAGYAVFPPNNIHEVAAEICDALRSDPGLLDTLCSKRIRWGQIGGASAIHPAATWDKVILGLLRSFRDGQDTAGVYPLAIELLHLMLERPAPSAWTTSSDFITRNIDTMSGWETEARYFSDLADRELAATRKNHLIGSLGQPFGQARHFLRLFSLFALADDFAERGRDYPRALRFGLYLDGDVFAGRWAFRFLDRVRSVRWRPESNHADDQWLAQSLVARLIDDLDHDVWGERVNDFSARPLGLEANYRLQIDYALDARLLLGGEPECYFQFEGRTVRWINPTPENRALLTIGCDDQDNPEAEHDLVGRLLSLLTWQHRSPIRIEDVYTGARRPLPWISMTRAGYANIAVYEPEKQFPTHLPTGTWELLALWREAEGANSVYYRFLGYWKILESAINDPKERQAWINENAPKHHDSRLVDAIRAEGQPFSDYLQHWGRNAAVHVWDEPMVKPDRWRDFRRFSRDVGLIRWLAETLVGGSFNDGTSSTRREGATSA